MKIFRAIRRVLAGGVAIWALVLIVFYLFFARISFESSTATGVPGQPPVIVNSSGQLSWLSQAQPIAIVFMAAFSLLLALAGFAVWRGAMGFAFLLSLLALVFTFITGFSIGGLYFPGAAAAFLGSLLLVVEKFANRPERPIA
jgi:hypothetical protein